MDWWVHNLGWGLWLFRDPTARVVPHWHPYGEVLQQGVIFQHLIIFRRLVCVILISFLVGRMDPVLSLEVPVDMGQHDASQGFPAVERLRLRSLFCKAYKL
jgi:hypothetical protein